MSPRPERSTARLAANTLSWALLALVVSWWLGVEQVVPGVVLLVGAWRLWLRGALAWTPEARLFAALCVWSLASATAISGGAEWLLWARGEAHLAVALATLLVAGAVAPEGAAFRRFLTSAAALVGAVAALAALVAAGLLPLEFPSPLTRLLPEVEVPSAFLEEFILRRRFGTTFGVSLLPGLDRQSSFFLYQGGLATALLVLQGWMLVAWHRLEGARRRLAAVAVGLCLALVPLTGSRTGVLLGWGVMAALALWRLVAGKSWRRWAIRALVVVLLLAALVAVIPVGDGTSLEHGALWERVLTDFRVKSFLDRLEVYRLSIERLAERPWTGWGIQGRPGESQKYLRLGTHSEMLNVAYRFGWVGLALLVAAAAAWGRWLLLRSADRPERPALVVVAAALAATALVRTFQWDLNVLWLVAAFVGSSRALLARDPTPGPLSPFSMLGAELTPRTMDELGEEIGAAVAGGRRLVVGHQNLHGLYLLPREPAMREFSRRADLVFLDGMALVLLARALDHPVERRHRVTYADWVDPLMALCARRGWRVFHLGGRPGVGERAREVLERRHPGLEMATLPGYFDAEADERILAALADFDPSLVMVGMGMPRQEAWVVANLDRIGAERAILTCGACMDYVAGVIATPPRWMGRAGLEWLYRLISEPRRLAVRYLVEPWPVLWRFAGEWWARRR